MDALDEIEAAMKSMCEHAATGPAWFEEHWKPKFDKIKSLLAPHNCPITATT